MTVTVIKHMSTTDGFVQVITTFENNALVGYVQRYKIVKLGGVMNTINTVLEESELFSSEPRAVQYFNERYYHPALDEAAKDAGHS